MSIPEVPGYIQRATRNTLADLWLKPAASFPEVLWPVDSLRTVSSSPSEWLTIEEHFFTEEKHGGRGCVLIRPDQANAALQRPEWLGTDLGSVSIWDSGGFSNGLENSDSDTYVAFLAQARRASGAPTPIIEISQPFLWYWDAFPVPDGWNYLNHAGREQGLIRWQRSNDSWKIEVQTLELRQFLAVCGRSALLQIDYVHKVSAEPFNRVDDNFKSEWAHFTFNALHEVAMGDRAAFSRLLGQYVISGLRNAKVSRFETRRQDTDYPTFIYALDKDTGEPLAHICDPDELGTYFDKNNTRLHYLTPVYFRREVLQPYAAEPGRYSLSATRLSCLDLWGVSISFNSAGLVEVYLGDLGRDLPSDEWGHWRSYNVPPEGKMDEGRFRRDFLNQWADSNDPMGELRRARREGIACSEQLLGLPIWKELPEDLRAEFDSLIGPLADDPAALGSPLLLLTKVMIDGIDPKPLKSYLKTFEKDEKSLRLLQRFSEDLGDSADCTKPLRDLQSFRSKGGIAHLAGSGKTKAKEDLGIAGLSNWDAFESVVVRITSCLKALINLMSHSASA